MIINYYYYYLDQTVITVLTATKDVADWIILASLLGVSAATVKRIKAKEPEPLTQQKEIIEKWLQLGTASWAVLVSGLRHDLIQEINTADKIARQHPSTNDHKKIRRYSTTDESLICKPDMQYSGWTQPVLNVPIMHALYKK